MVLPRPPALLLLLPRAGRAEDEEEEVADEASEALEADRCGSGVVVEVLEADRLRDDDDDDDDDDESEFLAANSRAS